MQAQTRTNEGREWGPFGTMDEVVGIIERLYCQLVTSRVEVQNSYGVCANTRHRHVQRTSSPWREGPGALWTCDGLGLIALCPVARLVAKAANGVNQLAAESLVQFFRKKLIYMSRKFITVEGEGLHVQDDHGPGDAAEEFPPHDFKQSLWQEIGEAVDYRREFQNSSPARLGRPLDGLSGPGPPLGPRPISSFSCF